MNDHIKSMDVQVGICLKPNGLVCCRKKEKEKRKRKIAEARARGESLGPTRKSLKDNSMKNSACKIRVVIDCSFDQYMNDKVHHLVFLLGFNTSWSVVKEMN